MDPKVLKLRTSQKFNRTFGFKVNRLSVSGYFSRNAVSKKRLVLSRFLFCLKFILKEIFASRFKISPPEFAERSKSRH